jgi:Leucine-rich repeat (LRR) protein
LSLLFNQLQGNIPDLDSILGLEHLDLAFNSLSGELPSSIYNLSSLQIFQIQGNMFHGGIPADTGSRFPSMRILAFFRNQFTGPIPASLSNFTNLQLISLASNRLTGYVPPTLGKLQALQGLNLHNNKLQADDKAGWEFITSLSNCSQLQRLTIGGIPGLTWQVPSEIGNLSKTLQILLLEDTGISG